ncbi:pyridoxal-dependent decarboxylase, exosortase A system-associated [Sphingomicrobium marinum]|uniref:pyridoxal-dependent decarboxylase, exosortase A system-associated n=1 Tax=Sphingomicrobium marinum TaxID=1227950 RepID=UPI002240697D|nr:pyridoxal-dependent decarboxylase, exosortase A system-associated [Sphingomicrobium marinum]
MKPMGPIPPFFEAGSDGELVIAGKPASAWLDEADAPAFVYDKAIIEAKVAEFRAAMPDRVALHYAVKANSYGPLLEHMAKKVDGFDLASRGELERVDGLDLPLSIAGPGKSDADIAAALQKGVTIHLESEGEADRALAVAEAQGTTPRLAIRINPPFILKGAGMKMGGLASQFGIDAERVGPLALRLVDAGADFQGYHLYAGSQSLSAEAIAESQLATIDLTEKLVAETGIVPREVNLGGGFGIPYFANEKPLDISVIGDAIGKRLQDRPALSETKFILELGRWLVGEAGVYLTRVLDRKQSHGETFLTTDGGMHHVLAASGNLGQFLRRNYPITNASRFADEPTLEASVVGRLCTPLDLLGDEVMLADTQVGDVIALFCQGAYGLTASPNDFLSQPKAREHLA